MNTSNFILPTTLLGAVALAGSFYLYGKHQDRTNHNQENPATITVTGEGKAYAPVDIAELRLGVSLSRQPSSKAAMQLLATKSTQILSKIKALGVTDKDITTENLSLVPFTTWHKGAPKVSGFDASQHIRIKVRDLDQTSAVLAAATDAGANWVSDVTFTVDDPEKAKAIARGKAIDQAREKAEKLALQLGVRLGRVKEYVEGGMMPTMGNMMNAEAAAPDQTMNAAPTSAVPIPAGDVQTEVSATIRYELK